MSTNQHGYQDFALGGFNFRRDEYFAHINWKTTDGRPLSHTLDINNFLRALMRDVAWGFFYGGVNFDHVIGTTNHYKTVDLYCGRYNATMKAAGVDRLENFPDRADRQGVRRHARRLDQRRLRPLRRAAGDRHRLWPQARQQPRADHAGPRARQALRRLEGRPRAAHRCARRAGEPRVRRCAAGASPSCTLKPGFENEVHAFNLFGFLSRSQVTWNPSFTSVVKYSFMCPTTEEHILPIIHANDRVEWFFQMCDEIHWDCADKTTGKPLARVIMKAGDMAAMPAYCRHQGYSPKRSMLLVWENGSPNLVYEIQKGEAPEIPVKF